MANQRISVTITDEELESLIALAAFWRISISAAAGRCIVAQLQATADDVNTEYATWLRAQAKKEGVIP